MKDKKQSGGISVGFCGMLGIVFIVLKLCGVISWNWVWVLAPIWIPWVLLLLALIITLIIAAIGDKKDGNRDHDS